ncbi:MAG: tetratricopeptide repeat protein [Terriglobia bacterium]
MRTRLRTLIAWTVAGFLITLAIIPLGASQQGEDKFVSPELPAPVLIPEAAPQPPKPANLSLSDRADIFMARKSYSDAIDYYRRAITAAGRKDPPLWNKLGIAYQHTMNYGAARKAYKEAMRLDTTFAEPWNNMGTTYYLNNKAKKSIKYYRQAIKLNPNNASFHTNLGTAYYERKKYKEAIEEYQTAITLDPNVLTQHSAVGTVMQARAADARFYFLMAKVFASKGRAEEAVRYLRRALEDGFSDQKAMDNDPDLKKISEFPAYVELRKNPPVAIKE